MDVGVGLGDGELVLDDVAEGFFGRVAVGQGEEGAHVALGEAGAAALLEQSAGQTEEAELVGDAALALAEAGGELGLREVICEAKRLQRKGFLEEVEVGALKVFQQGEEGGAAILGVDEEAGDGGEACGDGGAQAAFARDEVVAAVFLPESEGLEDADFPDGGGELGEGGGVEVAAGLVGRGVDEGGGDVVEGFGEGGRLVFLLKKHGKFTSGVVVKVNLPYFSR